MQLLNEPAPKNHRAGGEGQSKQNTDKTKQTTKDHQSKNNGQGMKTNLLANELRR